MIVRRFLQQQQRVSMAVFMNKCKVQHTKTSHSPQNSNQYNFCLHKKPSNSISNTATNTQTQHNNPTSQQPNSSEQTLPKKYILSQFPYPSGQLHLGHARVYYIGDSLSQYYRLKNHHVIYPIGWDSFGLPAQNAALLHNIDPSTWTQSNISKMKSQLHQLNIKNFNWEMQLSTCEPQYYKWTQNIFLKMFRKGLAYKKLSQVNWDPIDKTVLANEQVDAQGRSWRSGAKVEKRELSQWFLKTTDYAEELQKGLEGGNDGDGKGLLDCWVEKVKNMQQGWIGWKKGYVVRMELERSEEKGSERKTSDPDEGPLDEEIEIFYQKPQEWTKACFIIKHTNSTTIPQPSQSKSNPNAPQPIPLQKIGTIYNPIQKQSIPVYLSPYQPSQKFIISDLQSNALHKEIFKQLSLSIFKNPSSLSQNVKHLMNKSKASSHMKLKDWLISRQRYWGCPIPVVYCDKCGIVPVKEEDLPVMLPKWSEKSAKDGGNSSGALNNSNPLLHPDFTDCLCPQCQSPACRQTDTMDTFVDSSWYYLRFLNHNDPETGHKQIFDKQIIKHMMPVDIYIGGMQHAIMHLLYARFVMRFLQKEYQLPENSCKEPFKELVVQGLVKGKTYKLKNSGKYVSEKSITEEKLYKWQDVEITYEKMSKSKFNGLNPNTLVEKYGSDPLRLALFFANPPDRDIDFNEDIVINAEKFLNKVQQFWVDNLKQLQNIGRDGASVNGQNEKVNLRNNDSLQLKGIFDKLQISIETRSMHTYVANVMEMFNVLKEICSQNQDRTNSKDAKLSQQQEESNKLAPHDKIKLFSTFVCVLKIIAPMTSNKLQSQICRTYKFIPNKIFEQWPSDSLFGKTIETLVMKGKKLIKKQSAKMSQTDEEIVRELNLEKEKIVSIKRQKKRYIIIIE